MKTKGGAAAFDLISVARKGVAERQVVVLDRAASHKANEIFPNAAELSGLLQELCLFNRLWRRCRLVTTSAGSHRPKRSATTARTLGAKITQDRRKTARRFSLPPGSHPRAICLP